MEDIKCYVQDDGYSVIEIDQQCGSCSGTGVYKGFSEKDGAGVVCNTCDGTGRKLFKHFYKVFEGRKIRDDVDRVYRRTNYVLGTGKIVFNKGTRDEVEIDMDKEGVSYLEFLQGKMPNYIEKLQCPMLADQGACHDIQGFVERCNKLNDGWLGYIPECKYLGNKSECWKIFNVGKMS